MILEYHYHLIQSLYWRKNHNDKKESESGKKTEMVDPVKAKWPKDNTGPVED